MGRRCLPFTFPSNVFNFARPAYCRRNKSKSLSALRDPGLFLFCAPPLAAASWARKKRRIPDAEKVVSFFSCFLRNSPLASHLVPPESLANPHFSHFLPSHPALSRISQLSCLFTAAVHFLFTRTSAARENTARNGVFSVTLQIEKTLCHHVRERQVPRWTRLGIKIWCT